MKKYILNGQWEMSVNGEAWQKAVVPGSVYSALLENGVIEDPYYRCNELEALKIMEKDFEFKREFELTPELKACPRVLLRCEGLDTLCEVLINGDTVGRAFNFHRVWEFDVTNSLKDGINTIQVKIASPIKFIRQKDKEFHVGGSPDAMRGFPHLRKPHCMFGWDWGPRLPDAGIWRDIMLIGVDSARIEDIYITQEHNENEVYVTTKVRQTGEAVVRISITAPDGHTQEAENGNALKIDEPQLWWPNGYGEQPLYNISVELTENGVTVDTAKRRIGLRTMTIFREKDQWGESFEHSVNGLKIFAMGADYIPEDNLLSRVNPQRTRRLLELCKAANFNVIRVWGGGYYPDNWFYDICDELGLIVWQDFMFSCANYPPGREFEENISREIEDNAARLRHHASLGLWCGNNEMEMFTETYQYDGDENTKAHYLRMYENVIPEVLSRVDPQTFYWPASPSSGGSFDEPNSPDRGDVHYWEVWHGGVPFSEYRKYFFRYASEFGFQSFPPLKTVESFTLPEDRNIFSRVMEMHQRNEGANGKILGYLSKNYLYPTSFEMLIYASQLLQAEAIKYGVEHWRRNRGRCMGAIYWQLNDIWPVASWASIDYFGRLKALHYFAKRFFAPLMISCHEECETTNRTSVVMEPTENISTARLSVANESREDVSGVVRWALCDQFSHVLQSGEETVTVPKLSSIWLNEMDFSDKDFLSNHLSFSFEVNGCVVSSGSVLFTAPKHYHFANPELHCEIQGDSLLISAKAYAKGIEILSPDCDMLLSDNYFDMEAGTVSVKILEGKPKHITLRSVFDIR